MVAANIKAGAVEIADLTVTGTLNAVNFISQNVTTGTVTAQNLTTNSFTAFQGIVDSLLVESGLLR